MCKRIWKRDFAAAFILLTFILGLSMFISLAVMQDDIAHLSMPVVHRGPTRKMTTAYITHGPIVIDSDNNFTATALAKGWPGLGSPGDPFIIRNYSIDLGGAIGHCINISNTRVSFIIRNCSLTGANVSTFLVDSAGVFLKNVTNGEIVNNICTNDWYAIYLTNSTGNTIANNTCSYNLDRGICLEQASNFNIIKNNTCNSNTEYGISLYQSDYNEMINNTCSDNINDGIYVYYSDYTLLINNTCYSNTQHGINLYFACYYSEIINNTCSDNTYGIYVYASRYNLFTNNTCKTNDYGIVFDFHSEYNEVINNTCSDNIEDGILVFEGSDYNLLANNTCSDNSKGITVSRGPFVGSSSHNLLVNNICERNGVGIRLLGDSSDDRSLYNEIINNTCSDNIDDGIYVIWSNYTLIANNTCERNSDGIVLWLGSDHNDIINNTCSVNSLYGIYVYASRYNLLANNNCSDNSYGISLDGSYNLLFNNTCSDNDYGIVVCGSYNRLFNNTCSDNDMHDPDSGFGILLYSISNYNLLANNTCERNDHGIGLVSYLYSPDHNEIINNTCSDNMKGGIYLDGPSYNLLANNTCERNDYGIYFGSLSEFNEIINNTCSDNTYGIYLDGADHNLLANNTCERNDYGIGLVSSLTWSNDNTLVNNTCSWNTFCGILLNVNTHHNVVTNCTCNYNGEFGIMLAGSDHNNITSNTCNGNLEGIHISDSDSNIIANNTVCHNTGPGIRLLSTSLSNTVQWNILMNNSYNVWNDHSSNVIDYNYYSDYDGYDNDGNGIGDVPYLHDGSANSEDTHPYMFPGGYLYITWTEAITDQFTEYMESWQYDIDVIVKTNVYLWWINDTAHFSVDPTGLITNKTPLVVGTYGVMIYVNDTEGHVLRGAFTLVVYPAGAPEWVQAPTDQTIEFGATFQYDLDAVAPSGIDFWQINDTARFHIDQTGLITNATVLIVGTYHLEVIVNDTLGQVLIGAFTLVVDPAAPPEWVQEPTDKTIEFGATFQYDLDVVDTSEIDLWLINDTVRFHIDQTGLITNATVLMVGVYYLEVMVNDTLGHVQTAEFAVIIQDTTAPTWDVTPTNQVIEYGSLFSYDLDASDLSSIHHWWLNDTTSFAIDSNGVITNVTTLAIGVHGLQVWVNDTIGNIQTAAFSISVEDTTDPVITAIPEDIEFEEGETGYSITWQFHDLDPSTYTIYLNGEILLTGQWNSSSEVFIVVVDGLATGSHNFTIVVTDGSGNPAMDEVTVTVTAVTTTPTTTTTTTTTTLSTEPDGTLMGIMLTGVGGAAIAITIVIISLKKRRRQPRQE